MNITRAIPYNPGKPLPIQPGDTVYMISPYDLYDICEERIHGVAVFPKHCSIILDGEVFPVVADCDISEIDKVFFLTRDDAEKWKKKHLTAPPYMIDDCEHWVSPDQFIPRRSSWGSVYVKLLTAEGIVKTEAYYDDGSQYPEDKGFWDGTGRHSKKLTNVIAWIGCKKWDPEDNNE